MYYKVSDVCSIPGVIYIYLLAYLHMFYMLRWQHNSPISKYYSFISFCFQVSVSCGIPDFRSRDGIYARLAVEFPDLPDPQAMFDIKYFKNDPRPFFKFAKVIIIFSIYNNCYYEIFFDCCQLIGNVSSFSAMSSLEIYNHAMLRD